MKIIYRILIATMLASVIYARSLNTADSIAIVNECQRISVSPIDSIQIVSDPIMPGCTTYVANSSKYLNDSIGNHTFVNLIEVNKNLDRCLKYYHHNVDNDSNIHKDGFIVISRWNDKFYNFRYGDESLNFTLVGNVDVQVVSAVLNASVQNRIGVEEGNYVSNIQSKIKNVRRVFQRTPGTPSVIFMCYQRTYSGVELSIESRNDSAIVNWEVYFVH
jgi:hypothetical protein